MNNNPIRYRDDFGEKATEPSHIAARKGQNLQKALDSQSSSSSFFQTILKDERCYIKGSYSNGQPKYLRPDYKIGNKFIDLKPLTKSGLRDAEVAITKYSNAGLKPGNRFDAWRMGLLNKTMVDPTTNVAYQAKFIKDGIVAYEKAPQLSQLATKFQNSRVVKGVGKAALVFGIAVSVADIYSTAKKDLEDDGKLGKETTKAVGRNVGGWAGGFAGAKAGALIGGAIGSAVPVLGTAAGALVGGIVGGIAGSVIGSGLGEKAGGWLHDNVKKLKFW